MKTHSNEKTFPNLQTMLKGYAVGFLFAILAFFITENFVISLAAYVSIGTTVGLAWSGHRAKAQHPATRGPILIMLLGIGVILFLIFLLV
jgi:hypothetical protein